MENNIKMHIEEICAKASKASKSLFHASSETKNLALKSIAKHINKNIFFILITVINTKFIRNNYI